MSSIVWPRILGGVLSCGPTKDLIWQISDSIIPSIDILYRVFLLCVTRLTPYSRSDSYVMLKISTHLQRNGKVQLSSHKLTRVTIQGLTLLQGVIGAISEY